jgi:putative PEP-CTERM system TPR-repeat lipoprotein
MLDGAADDPQLHGLMGVPNMRLGNYAEAAQYFERASDSVPENAALRTQLALTHLQLGQTETAIKGLESALDRDPNLRQASVLLILTHVRNQELGAAMEAIENLRKQLPDSPLPDHYIGAVRTAQLDLPAAREAFERAVQRDAGFFPARLALARLDVANGDLAAAKRQYDAILGRDPNNVAAMLAAADVANREAKPTEVIGWLDRAIKSNANAVQPRFQLANYLLARNDGSRALPVARELVHLAPNNNVALDILARAQLATGEVASALTSFRQIVQRAPNAGLAHLRLAQAQIIANDAAGARETLRRGTEVQPDFLPSWQEFAALELRTGTVETAARIANEFRRRRPEDPSGDILLGDVYYLGSRFKEAAEALTTAFQRQPSTALATRLADALNRSGNQNAAVSTLKGWADKQAQDPTARFALASFYIQIGRADDAIRDHEALLVDNPNNAVLMNNLAWLLQDRDAPRALQLAEKALAAAPNSPAINDTLGWIVLQKGDNARALPLLERAATLAPENPSIRYHYAVGLNRSGKPSDAKRVLAEVLDRKIEFEQLADARKLFESLP